MPVAARADMARRSMLGLAVLAVFLQGVGRAAGSDDASFSALVQMAPGRTDGWSLAFLNGQTTRLSLKSDGTGLIVTDTASTGTRGNWYFVGPAAFSGDMRAAYNGKLTFSIVQLSVADAKAKKDLKAPLVVLQAECWHYLWWYPWFPQS